MRFIAKFVIAVCVLFLMRKYHNMFDQLASTTTAREIPPGGTPM